MAADEQGAGLVGWLARLRAERARAATARTLYLAVVARARRLEPYAVMGVPDTPDGRFEMIGLETALVLRRLRSLGEEGERLGRALLEVMVGDLDRNLREMGVGDLSVGRWVKRMTASVLARAALLDEALARRDRTGLVSLLARAFFPDGPPAAARLDELATEVEAAAARLERVPAEALLAGRLEEPELRGRESR
jgi:cytochrome b pre-mRNA-processing protein 3